MVFIQSFNEPNFIFLHRYCLANFYEWPCGPLGDISCPRQAEMIGCLLIHARAQSTIHGGKVKFNVLLSVCDHLIGIGEQVIMVDAVYVFLFPYAHPSSKF